MKAVLIIASLIALSQALGAFGPSFRPVPPVQTETADMAVTPLNAFYNGIFQQLGLGQVNDSINCYNVTTQATQLSFFYSYAQAVAKGTAANAENNTWVYFNTTGATIYLAIPTSTLLCRLNSNDWKLMAKALGVDPNLTIFFDGYEAYMRTQSAAYYGLMQTMYNNFNSLNYVNAGVAMGQILQAAAKLAVNFQSQ